MEKISVRPSAGTSKRMAQAQSELDKVDDRILQLLKDRQEIVDHLATIKAEEGLQAYQPKRYIQMMKRITKKAKDMGLDAEMVRIVWNTLHQSSTEQQADFLNAASRGKSWLYQTIRTKISKS